jgi:sigma-B regulation protein RsbU (phosphoserine phosphatase)
MSDDPISDTEPNPMEASPAEPSDRPEALVLVVDDEPDLAALIRQKFRRRLRSGELEFLFAGDGQEALEQLKAHPDVDLVLTDINMPRMDGLTLLAELTRLNSGQNKPGAVVVTAYGDMMNIRTAMNRGAFDFITKPISFEDLAITIEKTNREIEVHRQAFQVQRKLTALHRELEIASRIQLSMLPSAFPAFPEHEEFELYATMIPAQEVGGDLYDCFLIGEDRLGFVIGDVAGKGVGASLFMAITRTILRATALRGLDPAACVREVNRVLYPESMAHMFVTLVYGVLDRATGAVSLCNAGHNKPYLVRADGTVEIVDGARGLGVCLTGDFDYAPTDLTLAPGDSLVLYTDGVTEAADPERLQFEDERLVACLERTGGEAPSEIIRDVLRAVEEFSAGAPPADDITLLVLRYTGGRDAASLPGEVAPALADIG